MVRLKENLSGDLPEIVSCFFKLVCATIKIISTDLLIRYFKSLMSHLSCLNKVLRLALICLKVQQQLSSTKSLIQTPQGSITTLISLLGALFSSISALPSPASSHFTLLVWETLLSMENYLWVSEMPLFYHDCLPMAGLYTELLEELICFSSYFPMIKRSRHHSS